MLLIIDGFDYYANLYYNWQYISDINNISITTASGPGLTSPGVRPGSSAPAGALKFNSGIANLWAGRNLYTDTTTASTIIMGFAIYIPSTSATYMVAMIGTGLNPFSPFTGIGWNPAGTSRPTGGFDIYDSVSSTWKNATPAVSLAVNTWHHVELKWFTGTCTIWVDGVSYMPLTTTRLTSRATSVFIGTNVALPAPLYVDDLYIMDDTGVINNAPLLDSCRVNTILPTGDGSYLNWTAKLGSLKYANINILPTLPQVSYSYYAATPSTTTAAWNVLPIFSGAGALTPTSTGTLTGFNLTPATQTTNFAFMFTMTLAITTSGTYTFWTNSDDGSDLWVGTTQVVNNDGSHAAQDATGTISLTTGSYTIKVHYFQGCGAFGLSVSYSGPDTANLRQLLPYALSSSEYVYSTSTDNSINTYTYAISTSITPPASVYGIKINTVSRKTPGIARVLQSVILSNDTPTAYPPYALTEDYTNKSYVLEVRPDTATLPNPITWVNLGNSAIASITGAQYGFALIPPA